MRSAGGEVRVPVREERLDVEKRQGEMGSVDIHKTVEAEQVNVPVELRHEEVTVNRVDVPNRPVSVGDAPDAFKEGTIRVPVRGEEAVARKEAVVTGEVVVDRDVVTERETISDTVRKEHVDVDENYRTAREGFRQHFESRRAGLTGTAVDTRTFEDAEPNYRRGFTAAHDERYRRPELRGRGARSASPASLHGRRQRLGAPARGDPRGLRSGAPLVQARSRALH